jgi:hypothetical protein
MRMMVAFGVELRGGGQGFQKHTKAHFWALLWKEMGMFGERGLGRAAQGKIRPNISRVMNDTWQPSTIKAIAVILLRINRYRSQLKGVTQCLTGWVFPYDSANLIFRPIIVSDKKRLSHCAE